MTNRHANYRARRVNDGARQKSFLLPAETIAELRRLSVIYGSETKAVTAAVEALDAKWRAP